MIAPIEFRRADLEELAEFAAFWRKMFEEVNNLDVATFAQDWPSRLQSYLRERIVMDEARVFVAVSCGEIVGTAGAMLADGYPVVVHGLRFGYVFGVRTDPEYRSRGVAETLTRNAVAFLRSKDCLRIRLHASAAGRPIYERIGFVPTNEMELRTAR